MTHESEVAKRVLADLCIEGATIEEKRLGASFYTETTITIGNEKIVITPRISNGWVITGDGHFGVADDLPLALLHYFNAAYDKTYPVPIPL